MLRHGKSSIKINQIAYFLKCCFITFFHEAMTEKSYLFTSLNEICFKFDFYFNQPSNFSSQRVAVVKEPTISRKVSHLDGIRNGFHRLFGSLSLHSWCSSRCVPRISIIKSICRCGQDGDFLGKKLATVDRNHFKWKIFCLHSAFAEY